MAWLKHRPTPASTAEPTTLRNIRLPQQQWKTIGILAFTQVASWGSLYYAFSILGPEIQKEMGWHSEWVFGAFSWSLLVAGLVSTPIGILLDRFGGRSVMGLGSLVCGAGFPMLSNAQLDAYAA